MNGDPNVYHDAFARANHEHGSHTSQPALFVHSAVTRLGKEEVRNAETQEGYGKIQKNAREGAAVGWRFAVCAVTSFGRGLLRRKYCWRHWANDDERLISLSFVPYKKGNLPTRKTILAIVRICIAMSTCLPLSSGVGLFEHIYIYIWRNKGGRTAEPVKRVAQRSISS